MKTIAALVAALCLAAPLAAQKSELKPAKLNFSFKDVNGKKVSLSAFLPLAEGKEDILKAYDVSSIPVSVIIDRQGRIVTRHLGIASMDVFEKELTSLF
jgi:hypothetical protein